MFCRGALYRFLLHHNLRLQIRLHLITFTITSLVQNYIAFFIDFPYFGENTLTFEVNGLFLPNFFNTNLTWALGGLLPACMCVALFSHLLVGGASSVKKPEIGETRHSPFILLMCSGWGQIGGVTSHQVAPHQVVSLNCSVWFPDFLAFIISPNFHPRSLYKTTRITLNIIVSIIMSHQTTVDWSLFQRVSHRN